MPQYARMHALTQMYIPVCVHTQQILPITTQPPPMKYSFRQGIYTS